VEYPPDVLRFFGSVPLLVFRPQRPFWALRCLYLPFEYWRCFFGFFDPSFFLFDYFFTALICKLGNFSDVSSLSPLLGIGDEN